MIPEIQANFEKLAQNPYPGRGIIIGRDLTGESYVQVYWVMGRSESSRNRRLVDLPDWTVKTEPHDLSKIKDPHLLIYTAMRQFNDCHVVSNGQQTDHIANVLDGINSPEYFEHVVFQWEYEPDAPNYTPRIIGLIEPGSRHLLVRISRDQASERSIYNFHHYKNLDPGIGYCLHTYLGDGNPLPAFDRDPYPVPLGRTANQIADMYWNALNQDNKVALAVKMITPDTHGVHFKIINKLVEAAST